LSLWLRNLGVLTAKVWNTIPRLVLAAAVVWSFRGWRWLAARST
jgi:hypothetical protein